MKIISFIKLSLHEKLMFFINFCLLGLARAAIHGLNYKRLKPYFGHSYPMKIASTLLPKEYAPRVFLIRRSILLAVKYTPWNSSCLTQAMVAKFWCQYYGIPYFLFVGFAKKSDKPIGKDAHAWITAGPIAITGGYGFEDYQVIYSYSNLNMIA